LPWQVSDEELQYCPPEQCELLRHCTHMLMPVSQCGVEGVPVQSALDVHLGRHLR